MIAHAEVTARKVEGVLEIPWPEYLLLLLLVPLLLLGVRYNRVRIYPLDYIYMAAGCTVR